MSPLSPTEEIKRRLRSGQSFFEQGDFNAAQPIFENVLTDVEEDTIEGALCLSNLVDIYETKGNLQSAIDCGQRLMRAPLVPAVAALRAAQLAELARQTGQGQLAASLLQESERWKKTTMRMQGTPAPMPRRSVFESEPDFEVECNWLGDALKSGAYALLERAAMQIHTGEFERNIRERQAYAHSDQSADYADWLRHLVSDRQKFQQRVASELAQMSAREPKKLDVTKLRTGKKAEVKEDKQKVRALPPDAEREKALAAALRTRGTSKRPPSPNLFMLICDWCARMRPKNVRPAAEHKTPQTPGQTQAMLMNLAVVAAALCFAVFAAWNYLPRIGNASDDWANMPHRFLNPTQHRQLILSSPHNLEMDGGPKGRQECRLVYYFGDWRDVVSLAFGAPNYYLQKIPLGLRDQNGTVYYATNTPEVVLAERCQLLMQDMKTFFSQHQKYPEDKFQLSQIDWQYDNPYTNGKDTVILSSFSVGSETAAETKVNESRNAFCKDVSTPQFWNKKHMHPGEIACIKATFVTARGSITVIAVSAAGREGKVMGANTAFRLVAEDGEARFEEPAKVHDSSNACILEAPLSTQERRVIDSASIVLAGLISLFLFAQARHTPPGSKARSYLFIGLGLSVVYALAQLAHCLS
jgi:hypothetical protein